MNINDIGYFGIDVAINHKHFHVTLEYVGRETVAYKKALLRSYPLGAKTKVTVDYFGRYKDENCGFHVILDDVATPLFAGRIPHITTEVKNGGYAVNTWKAFTDLSSPDLEKRHMVITGTIGFFTHDGHFHTEYKG